MTKQIFTLVAVVVIAILSYQGAAWWKSNKEMQIKVATEADAKMESLGIPTNCKDKEKCIVVFIAPWCGVCVSSEPTFQAFHKYLPKLRPQIGFGLIVGAGSPNENAAKRSELSPIEVYVDDTRNLMRNRNIDRFPTWIIIDKSGNEVSRLSGGFQVTTEATDEQALQEVLKL